MRLDELIRHIEILERDHGRHVFTLRDLSHLSGATRAATAMALLHAKERRLVDRVGTVWINLLHPPTLEELGLAIHEPSYISFESALYHHGVLSQSPRAELSLAVTGRPRTLATPLSRLRLIHLKPELFFGYDENRMASKEKAWFDLLYIRGRRGRDNILTEEFYLKNLNPRLAAQCAKKFPDWTWKLDRELRGDKRVK